MNKDCWIPELVSCADLEQWEKYYNEIYAIFHRDFVESHPLFEEKEVCIRRYPIEYGKEEAFFHVTCQDYLKSNDRSPDIRRCERIKWVRSFIENYTCDPSLCIDCDGIKVWSEPYKNTSRVYLLSEEEWYVVIVERRKRYVLLITAYYIDYDHTMDKLIRRWERHTT